MLVINLRYTKKKIVRGNLIVEYMFNVGFLGTRAPYFMDIVVLIVALLPLLVGASIWLAIKEEYRLHHITQSVLFVVTTVILIYFEYGIHMAGGFEYYMKESSFNLTMGFYLLIIHIIIATITMILWMSTLYFAKADRKRKALPGLYTSSHRKAGQRVAVAIVLTSVSGVGIYCILFIA